MPLVLFKHRRIKCLVETNFKYLVVMQNKHQSDIYIFKLKNHISTSMIFFLKILLFFCFFLSLQWFITFSICA